MFPFQKMRDLRFHAKNGSDAWRESLRQRATGHKWDV